MPSLCSSPALLCMLCHGGCRAAVGCVKDFRAVNAFTVLERVVPGTGSIFTVDASGNARWQDKPQGTHVGLKLTALTQLACGLILCCFLGV